MSKKSERGMIRKIGTVPGSPWIFPDRGRGEDFRSIVLPRVRPDSKQAPEGFFRPPPP